MPRSARPSVAHLAQVYYVLSENWVRTQIAHLHRYEPFVLTWETRNLEASEQNPYCYALAERLRLVKAANVYAERALGYYPSFRWVVEQRRAALLHAHFGPHGHWALPLARATGLPLVTSFYGYDLSLLPRMEPAWKERYAELFREGHCFLVEGPHMRRQLQALGCPAHKARIQHLGVDLSGYPYRPRTRRPGEPIRVLAAGRFTEKKGFVYALKAFAAFLAEGGEGTLTLVGDASEGDEAQQQTKRAILAAVAEQGLERHVRMPGLLPLSALARAYYEHHVFLSPSVQARDGDNEGGAPVTLIEASATGMPSVATTHCDIPEVVLHETTGFLAPERDPDALAQHLMRFFREPALIEAMGRAARRHVADAYDARKQGPKLERIYDSVRGLPL